MTTETRTGGGDADRDTLLENVSAARGKDTAARDTAIRAAVAAGLDLVDVGTAAGLSRDRVRQIAKTEHTRLMAAAYVTELIEHLQQAITHVTDADQTTAAASSVLESMNETEITGWLGLESPLDLTTTDRYDLMHDLREIRNRVRSVLRTAHHYLTRIDPDAVIAWLAPDRDTPASDDGDPGYGDAARRDKIVRALSHWCQRQRDREPNRRPPKETPTTYGTYPELYREPVEPDVNDLGDPALAAYVRHLDHHYTELRAHAADAARTVSLAEWHVALIGEYDLGIGIEPTADDYRDLLGGTWQLQHAVHNFHRIVERYYRRFDDGQGARTLTQQANTPNDDHSDACAQDALENIRRWHTEQQKDT